MNLFFTTLILLAGAATLGWFVIYASLMTEMFRHAGEVGPVPNPDPIVTQTLNAMKFAFPVALAALILSVVLTAVA